MHYYIPDVGKESKVVVLLDPFLGESRVLDELALVLRLRLFAGCRLDRNFLRLDLGLLAALANFSYFASNSGLFKID